MKGFTLVLAAFCLMLLCPATFAQTATPAPTPAPVAVAQSSMFTATTSAVGFHINGGTSAGTDASVAFALTNNIILASENILVPGINFQGYYGSVRYNLGSQLNKLASKTNIVPGTFNPYITGMAGVARYVPSTGVSTQHFSGAVGGGVDFNLTGSGSWTAGPRLEYMHAQGFGPSPNGFIVSANLTFIFAK